jgi:TM2 domain-containing membrane protein YozV
VAETTAEPAQPIQPAQQADTKKVIAVVLVTWMIPGMGHLVLRRWGRGLIFLGVVGTLAITGFLLRGNIFSAHAEDIFEFLGYLADLGSGIFFFFAKSIEKAGPDVSRAAGDYGTRFIATAGVVNMLCMLDAFEIAKGRKG